MSETPDQVPAARPYQGGMSQAGRPQPANLADILERILDKGIIMLTIKIRLLVVSVDKAQEMGIDWWRNDPMLSGRAQALEDENRELRERVDELESGKGS